MSSFKEKERLKEQQEQFQAVLSALLKDEDNKYCVDCDAKGPRWASWNIGIFLCIRCAGIHRNLGVHISKVKSVNLDTWTPEQVAMMQEMGNSRGRAVYEANIPDGFRRPQTDSSLEAFIRSKYETKKYIAREWIPPQPKVPKEWLDDPKGDKKKAKAKPVATSLQLTNVSKLVSKQGETTPPGDFTKPAQPPKAEVKVPAKTETVSHSASNDLLGLDLGTTQTNAQRTPYEAQNPSFVVQRIGPPILSKAAAPPPSYAGNELLDLFGGPQASQTLGDTVSAQSNNSDLMNGATEPTLFGDDKSTGGTNVKTSAKDSIMALYGGGGGSGAPQPQMYGVPGSRIQPHIFMPHDLTSINSPARVTGVDNMMKTHSSLTSSQAFDQRPVMFGQSLSQSQSMMQPPLSQSGAAFSSLATQQPPFNQSTASISALANQQPKFNPNVSDASSNKTASNSYVQSGQYQLFNQSSINGMHQQVPLMTSTLQGPTTSSQFLASTNQMPGFSSAASYVMEPQDFGQSAGSNNAWSNFNSTQSTFYGNQGGVYMPQGQQMYPMMMTQQQGMMGMQGIRQQGMMGQPQGMMGQPQGMGMVGQGMMGQNPGMMANPGMNTPQMAMFNSPMMAGNPGMYTPQQMQQLQFQQMQQQLTSLKLGGSQMSSVPQQTPGAGGWGNPGQGQTLSTNLWQ